MVELMSVSHIFVSGLLKRQTVPAVQGVSFKLPVHGITALVGSSGCGKTTLARMILGGLRPQSGSVCFAGRDIYRFSKSEMKRYRRHVQMICQNPEQALNPACRIRTSLLEALQIHRIGSSRTDRMAAVEAAMEQVGLSTALLERYPHEISGGEAQRTILCRALTLNPELLVMDEPTAMLDASVQAHILNLLKQIQQSRRLTYLLITHNLDVAAWFANHMMIMQGGEVVEQGPTDRVLGKPRHPYTQYLIESFKI